MNWRDRRDLLRRLDTIPGLHFSSSTLRDNGDIDYVEHYGIYDRPELGEVEVRCPNGKARYAYLKKNGRWICRASKLYRRIHGVKTKDPAYLIGEALRLPQASWTAHVRGSDYRFTCEHAIYGTLYLRTWDTLGEDALLSYGAGQKPVLAPALYDKLKDGLKDLRRALSGPRLWTVERKGKFTTNLNGQVVTLMSVDIDKQSYEFHLRLGSSVVSVSEYELWNQVRQNFEDSKQKRPIRQLSAPYHRPAKKRRRIHKGKRSSK